MGLPDKIGLPNTIITSDLHFTDVADDKYRWGLFPWLEQQIKKHKVELLIVPGDITDAKDNHSAALVNRITTAFAELVQSTGVRIYIIMGNHDCRDPATPFFLFMNYIPGITFVNWVMECKLGDATVGMLPHTRDPDTEWKAHQSKFKHWDLGIMHHTVNGSLTSNGQRLEGTSTKFFKDCPFISGDIHVPQERGTITYVGSPYHVHFGDRFTPRVLLYHKKRWADLHYPSLRRESLTLRSPEQLLSYGLNEGDQVKIELALPKAELHDWQKHKRRVREICDELGVQLFGIKLKKKDKPTLKKRPTKGEQSDGDRTVKQEDVFDEYCEKQKLDQPTVETGTTILKEVQ